MKNSQVPKSKNQLYLLTSVLCIASAFFRLIEKNDFEQSSLLFVGIPTLITLLILRFAKTPKTGQGITFRAITIFLLLSAILFGEGFVCILFASPIFYGIGASLVAYNQRYKGKNSNKLSSYILLPLIIVLGQPLDYNNKIINSVQSVSIVNNEISLSLLEKRPKFANNLPSFFKLGFPIPVKINGVGLKVGDKREIDFLSSTKGVGTLHLTITEQNENTITFGLIEDNTHINHWLSWKSIKVELIPINEQQTKIIWTSDFTCDLGPSWYFRPIEKYAVGIMNDFLIESFFH